MIEVFKIVHNVYDNRVAPSLSYYKFIIHLLPEVTFAESEFNHNFRNFFFFARTVIWNSLPNYVVDVQSSY